MAKHFTRDDYQRMGFPSELIIPEGYTSISPRTFRTSTGGEADLNIRSIVFPKTMIEINAYLCQDCTNLSSVTFGEGLLHIQTGAFSNTALKIVVLPKTVKTFSDAFSKCRSLQSITLSKRIREIENGAFEDCSSLEEIDIHEGVTSIGDRAFRHCHSLKRISMADGVTLIGYMAFMDCRSLRKIVIPDSVTKMDNDGYTFSGCTSLEEVVLSRRLAKIVYSAFDDCRALKKIILPEGLRTISANAFEGCSALEEISIPQSLDRLGPNAFKNCTSLRKIVLPQSVRSVEKQAFMGCKSLESVSLSKNLTHIFFQAFYNCTSLRQFTFPKGLDTVEDGAFTNTALTDVEAQSHCITIGGSILVKQCKVPILMTVVGSPTHLVIPEGVVKIAPKAFQECTSLVSVQFPSTLREIGYSAFSNCTSLTSITIPDMLNSIGDGAFSNTALTNINIPPSLTILNSFVFYRCPLTSIIIPEKVREIRSRAFSNCKNLRQVILTNKDIKIERHAFDLCENLWDVQLPKGLTWSKMKAGFDGSPWAQNNPRPSKKVAIRKKVKAMEEVTKKVLMQHTFTHWQEVDLQEDIKKKRMTITGSHHDIHVTLTVSTKYTLDKWKELLSSISALLKSLTDKVPKGTKGQYIINMANMIESTPSVHLQSLSNPGKFAFLIPKEVTSIAENLCKYCTTLNKLTIEGKLIEIPTYAFYGCTSLKEVVLPPTLITISEKAFKGCANLAKINFPPTLKEIGKETFALCAKLHKPTLEGYVNIGSLAFVCCPD